MGHDSIYSYKSLSPSVRQTTYAMYSALLNGDLNQPSCINLFKRYHALPTIWSFNWWWPLDEMTSCNDQKSRNNRFSQESGHLNTNVYWTQILGAVDFKFLVVLNKSFGALLLFKTENQPKLMIKNILVPSILIHSCYYKLFSAEKKEVVRDLPFCFLSNNDSLVSLV